MTLFFLFSFRSCFKTTERKEETKNRSDEEEKNEGREKILLSMKQKDINDLVLQNRKNIYQIL